MMKNAKKAIKPILGDADTNDQELLRVICGAERLLNSFNEKNKSYNYYLALRFRLHSCNKGTKL